MRGGRGGLLLRGVRWRLGVSLLTVLTATIAAGTAVLGPLYLHTAGDSVVRRTVDSASIEDRGLTVPVYQGQRSSYAQVLRAERRVERIGGTAHPYGSPITSVDSGVALAVPGQPGYDSELFARTGICRVLHFEQGGCDLSPGDVVVSRRTARVLHASLGGTLLAHITGRPTPLPLKITGIYAIPNLTLPYWWGDGRGDFPFGESTGPGKPGLVDPLIASPATTLDVPVHAVPEVVGQIPLRPGSVTLADEAGLQHALSATSGQILRGTGIHLSTGLFALLAAARHQRHVMGTIVAIAAVQLVLLSIWVLGSLLVRSSDARRSETRVARLRGFTTGSLLWVTVAEPAALCLLGIVLGSGLALGVLVAVRGQLFVPGSAIAFDGWAFAALGLTVLAIAGALGMGVVRLLRGSGLSGDSTATPRRSSVISLVADSLLVTLGVVALVALATSGALAGHSNPIASAAPGLIALAIAILAVRVILAACRIGIVASADSKWLGSFLALRQTARRPALLRQARVLIIALGLACFASSAWSVARANRTTVARFTVGADSVATVAPVSPEALQAAVARADPARHFAMAAVLLRTPSSTMLAVDAPRLASAATWPHGISRRTLDATARALDPRTAPEVRLPAGQVALSASTAGSSVSARALGDLDLSLWVSSPGAGTDIIDLGALRPGRSVYRGAESIVCGGGCRLAGIGLVPAGGQTPRAGAIDLTVGHVAVAGRSGDPVAIPADLTPAQWRTSASGVRLAPAASGLSFVIPAATTASYIDATPGITAPMAAPADHPTTLPAAVTSEVESLNAAGSVGSVPTQGLDASSINVAPAVTASTLPRVGADAVMIDLGLLTRAQLNPTSTATSDEVWLGPASPADALARLRSAGLTIDTVQHASTVLAGLQRTGPALADDFLLLATLAALLTAAAGTLGALGAAVRERATELVGLEVAGVPRTVLVRSLALESVILAATALCGAGAGVLAALLAIPSLPELIDAPIPLRYALPGGVIAAVSAAVLIVVAVASAGMTAGVLKRMSPMLLRTVPDDAAG